MLRFKAAAGLPVSWQSSLEPAESSWFGLSGGLAGGLVLKLA